MINASFLTIGINMKEELTTYSAVFGAVIANNRKSLGVDQAEMAEKMGLSQASYSRLESGKSSFSVDQMFQSAAALNLGIKPLLEQLLNTVDNLQQHQVTVKPQLRGNTTKVKQQPENNIGAGAFVAGAALTALIFGLAAKGK